MAVAAQDTNSLSYQFFFKTGNNDIMDQNVYERELVRNHAIKIMLVLPISSYIVIFHKMHLLSEKNGG